MYLTFSYVYYRTSTSSTAHSSEVCGGPREIHIAFRLSRGCTLPQWWLVTPY